MPDDALTDDLLALELAIAGRRPDDLPGGYAGVLDDEFRETGASGRSWTRDEMLAALAGSPPAEIEIRAFAIERLAVGVVLATYETGPARPARRVSIWVREGDRWRLRFHQGTPL